MESGLLILRLTLGLLMAAHGSQKLFGWFGGHGLAATGGMFESLGFRPGRFFAALASSTEVGGGLLVALGFLGPVGPALILSVMIVAAVSVHWKNGLFAMSNGIKLSLLYGIGAAALAFTGPGLYSIDATLGLTHFFTPAVNLGVVFAGIAGAVVNLALKRQPAAAQTA